MELIKRVFHKMGEQAAQKLTLEQLAFLSKSPSGYEREKAIDLLSELNDPRVLPLLIERLNDWVPTVKVKAETAFCALLTQDNGNHFAQLLVEIVKLNRCRRHDHSLLVNKVFEFLSHEGNQQHLVSAILSPDQKGASIAFKLVYEKQILSPIELVEIALQSKNLSAIKCAMPLIDCISAEDFKSIQSLLMRQKFPPIQIKAIKRLETIDPTVIVEMAESMIFSRNQELRNIGKQYLKLSAEAAIECYYKILEESNNLAKLEVALSEIAEYLGNDSVSRLNRYTQHPSIKIRKLAFQHLSKILAEDAKPLLMNGLLDECTPIKNTCVRLCVKSKIRFTAKEFVRLYEQQPTLPMLEAIFNLAKKNGKWVRLAALLEILQSSTQDTQLVRLINVEINQWNQGYNQSASQASKTELSGLRLLIDRNREFINFGNLKYLKFTFDNLV